MRLFGLRTLPGASTAFILRRRGPGLLRGMGDRAILDLSSMLWIYGWIIRRRYSNIYLVAIDFYSIRITVEVLKKCRGRETPRRKFPASGSPSWGWRWCAPVPSFWSL